MQRFSELFSYLSFRFIALNLLQLLRIVDYCLKSKPTKPHQKAHKIKTKERRREKNEGKVKDNKEKVPGNIGQSQSTL